jgi:hypothetical protein
MQDSIFIGLDVHKATIAVAIARGERGGVRHWGTIPNRADHVRKRAQIARARDCCDNWTRWFVVTISL